MTNEDVKIRTLESVLEKVNTDLEVTREINLCLESRIKALQVDLDREMTYKEALERTEARIKELEAKLKLSKHEIDISRSQKGIELENKR